MRDGIKAFIVGGILMLGALIVPQTRVECYDENDEKWALGDATGAQKESINHLMKRIVDEIERSVRNGDFKAEIDVELGGDLNAKTELQTAITKVLDEMGYKWEWRYEMSRDKLIVYWN